MSEDSKYDDIKLKVEAVLFAYGDWISVNDIKGALGIDSKKLVDNALQELEEKYKEGYSYIVESNEDKWRMILKEEYEESISELVSGTEIPKPVLKVLSVIAYEQPVTKTRLSEIIGRYVKPEVDYLFKAKFINYEKQGNGKYYRVTKKFYDYFKIDENTDFRDKANEKLETQLEEPVALNEKEDTVEEHKEASENVQEDTKVETNKEKPVEELVQKEEQEGTSEEETKKKVNEESIDESQIEETMNKEKEILENTKIPEVENSVEKEETQEENPKEEK